MKTRRGSSKLLGRLRQDRLKAIDRLNEARLEEDSDDLRAAMSQVRRTNEILDLVLSHNRRPFVLRTLGLMVLLACVLIAIGLSFWRVPRAQVRITASANRLTVQPDHRVSGIECDRLTMKSFSVQGFDRLDYVSRVDSRVEEARVNGPLRVEVTADSIIFLIDQCRFERDSQMSFEALKQGGFLMSLDQPSTCTFLLHGEVRLVVQNALAEVIIDTTQRVTARLFEATKTVDSNGPMRVGFDLHHPWRMVFPRIRRLGFLDDDIVFDYQSQRSYRPSTLMAGSVEFLDMPRSLELHREQELRFGKADGRCAIEILDSIDVDFLGSVSQMYSGFKDETECRMPSVFSRIVASRDVEFWFAIFAFMAGALWEVCRLSDAWPCR